MAAFAAADGAVAGPRIATESLRAVLLWLMAFAGGFVFIEPGPYEFVGARDLFLFAVTGLTLRAGAGAARPAADAAQRRLRAVAVRSDRRQMPAVIWVLVSVFLSLTAIFFAAMLGDQHRGAPALAAARLHRRRRRGLVAGDRRLFRIVRRPVRPVLPRHRHVQGSERVRGVPGAARAAHPAAHAGRTPVGVPRRRHPAAAGDGRAVPVVLARRLGPVRAVRDPADGAHLRDQPLAERALPDRRGGDHGRRGGGRLRRGAAVGRAGRERCSRSARR